MQRSKEVIVYVAGFTGPLAGNLVLALLGTLGDAWQVGSVDILLSIPAFMFPFAILQLFSGAISDTYDRRSTLLFGLGTYAAGSALAVLSTSLGFFILTRVVQGVGYAFVNPVLVALLSEISTPDRQGRSMGYFGSSTTAGVSAGPLLGGASASIDWRLAFLVIALLAGSMFVAVWYAFKGERRGPGKASFAAVAGQLSAAFRDRRIVRLSAAGFLAFMAFAGVISFVSDFLEMGPLALSPEEVGVALSASGVVGIFFAPVAGTLVDRRGARCCAAVGFALAASAAFILQYAGSYQGFVALLVLSGMGGSFVWSSLLTMVVAVPPRMKGTSSSVFNSTRFLGFALSPIMLTPLYTSAGFEIVMVACALMGVGGLVLAALPKHEPVQG
ncbi:TPA: MFS transporter [Thermoplasmata archaeon]|nr:MFS transporter [Thermoplasmata archaeon]